MQTNKLTGAALDWAVAKSIGHRVAESYGSYIRIYLPDLKQSGYILAFCPSTDWAQGGPIIEREKISVWARSTDFAAESFNEGQEGFVKEGPTPLIAAMRCYVSSKMGDDIELPEELK